MEAGGSPPPHATLAFGLVPGRDFDKLAPTDRPDLGHAMIFPGMTIVKILFVDIACALLT